MLELKENSEEVSKEKKNSILRSLRKMNAKAKLFRSAKTPSEEKPINGNLGQEGSHSGLSNNNETVFADPGKNEKICKAHRLIRLSGNSNNQTYFLDHPKLIIGRDRSCHIRMREKTVSLYHAMICAKANGCTLKDLDSKNGTIVNGVRIKDTLQLKDGDKIKIGSSLFAFMRGDVASFQGALQSPRKTSRRMTGMKAPEKSIFAIAGVLILVCFIYFSQIKSDNSQPGTAVDRKTPVAITSSARIKQGNPNEAKPKQQKITSAKHKENSLDEKGLQLIEKAIDYYINGNISLSITMVEEILQFDLPDNSAIKTKALAINDKALEVYMLYQEGLNQYNKRNMEHATEIWSKALKANEEIVGGKSSHFANQIAIHTGDLYYQRALEALKEGDRENAQQFCSQAFRAQPGHEGCVEIMNTL
jgi:pSer/pThr/pTyr-binding forkhead associated (FHA) protein